MATTESRQDISMPFMQVRYIKCTEKIPGFLVAVTGLLTSLWANCIIIVMCYQEKHSYYDSDSYNYNNNQYSKNQNYIPKTIIQTFQITHLTIVLTCTAGLILGLKEKNRSHLLPWLIIKIIELLALLVGCIMAAIGLVSYIGLLPLEICFLLIGAYISLCVWNTYRKMDAVNRTTSLEDFSLSGPDDPPLPNDPPSYDHVLHGNTHTMQDIISKHFRQIRYIKCTEKIPGFLVAVTGLLTSLWVNCIMIVICYQGKDSYYSSDGTNFYNQNSEYRENYIPKTIIKSSQITHLIIVLTCTAGLILGLKEKILSNLLPWLVIKIIELIALLFGCIKVASGQYIGLMPLGFCFLLIGSYISLSVWNTYRKISAVNRTTSLEDISLSGPDDPPLPDDPPRYEHVVNGNTRLT